MNTMSYSRTSTTTGPTTTGLIDISVEGDWTARAACRGIDPDELFVQGAAQNRAKNRCMGCVVRTECLSDALDNRVEFGVWGGMTGRERRALLRRRPDGERWSRRVETALAESRRSG